MINTNKKSKNERNVQKHRETQERKTTLNHKKHTKCLSVCCVSHCVINCLCSINDKHDDT